MAEVEPKATANEPEVKQEKASAKAEEVMKAASITKQFEIFKGMMDEKINEEKETGKVSSSSLSHQFNLISALAPKKDTEVKEEKKEEAKDKCCKGKDEKTDIPEEPSLDTISRGMRPEAKFDHETVRDIIVYDEMGNQIRFGDIYKMQKTIIIFIRHFLDFITKEYVEDLALIPLEYLQAAGVRLVVIGPSPFKHIKSFKELTKYQYTMYCDPEREVYKALGLKEKNEFGPLHGSKHVKSGVVSGVLKSMWRAMKLQEYMGNPKQQGGSFVLGPGDAVEFTHKDERNTDHMSINELLEEAGVQLVSFPNDRRVITV